MAEGWDAEESMMALVGGTEQALPASFVPVATPATASVLNDQEKQPGCRQMLGLPVQSSATSQVCSTFQSDTIRAGWCRWRLGKAPATVVK